MAAPFPKRTSRESLVKAKIAGTSRRSRPCQIVDACFPPTGGRKAGIDQGERRQAPWPTRSTILGAGRRSCGRPDDYGGMTHPQVRPDPAFGLLELYDDALPHVYGYLLARCGDAALAEELTAEAFLAAVHAARKPGAAEPSVPWLIGVARHKLADHWRRAEREQRGLRLLDSEPPPADDPWETAIDQIRAR